MTTLQESNDSRFLLLTRSEWLWLLSSVILFFFSRIFEQSGPAYQGGALYIILNMIYLFIVFFIFRRESDHNPPRAFVFFLGVLPILFTQPLFENDHFRYLWEGKSWNLGINPYQVAASNVALDVENELRGLVGYPSLTTVYPFLSQAYFRIFSFFPWEYGLKAMQFISAVLVFFGFQHFWNQNNAKLFPLTVLFWQKEFIQSVHIDLLSATIFFIWMSRDRSFRAILIGGFVKILPFLYFPFLIFKEHRSKNFWKEFMVFSFFFLIFCTIQLYLLGDLKALTGIQSFSRQWIWNPGLYSILIKLFPSSYEELRIVTFGLWGITLIFLLKWIYRYHSSEQSKWVYCFISFATMMFCSPVYNAWYAIWFLIPALMLNSSWGVLFALMGCWSYFFHGFPDYVWISEVLSHILIFPAAFFLLKDFSQRVELHEELPSAQNLAQ